MDWLLRYALFCGVELDLNIPHGQDLRRHFSAAAWRLICRTERQCFLPILRHRSLNFSDLAEYAQALVIRGWKTAPSGRLLAFFIDQSYLYFDNVATAPATDEKFNFLWVAGREPIIARSDLALVYNWKDLTQTEIERNHRWGALVRKARAWRNAQNISIRHQDGPQWHFFCHSLSWRGYELVPLRSPRDLWDEGAAMSNCLYKLRRECAPDGGSRYFSMRRFGRRVATLELMYQTPDEKMRGQDACFGRWEVLDCRFAYNRIPDSSMLNSMRVFAWQYTLWSRRPARARPQSAEITPASIY